MSLSSTLSENDVRYVGVKGTRLLIAIFVLISETLKCDSERESGLGQQFDI